MTDPTELNDNEKALAASGKKIEAIKFYRARMAKPDLTVAKAVVDDFIASLCVKCNPEPEPEPEPDPRDEAVRVLAEVLSLFDKPGHPGRPCLSPGWLPVEWVAYWRAVLERAQGGGGE